MQSFCTYVKTFYWDIQITKAMHSEYTYGGLGNTGETGQGHVVGSLVVELDSLEVLWLHDAAAAIGISEIPESDDPVRPSRENDRVVVKDTGCEPSHTLLLMRLSYRSRRETILQQYYRQSYLCFFV